MVLLFEPGFVNEILSIQLVSRATQAGQEHPQQVF